MTSHNSIADRVTPGNDFSIPDGAQAVAQLVAGVAAEAVPLDSLDAPWKEIAGALIPMADGTDRLDTLYRLLDKQPNADALLRQVFEADPAGGGSAREESSTTALVPAFPPLPTDVRLDPTLGGGVCPWLDGYLDHARKVAPMTPCLFHESAGLFLASAVVARRLVVPMGFDHIYPNLWVLWVATTTLFSKSTAMGVARRLLQQHYAHLLLPERATPEALFGNLAGRQPTHFETMTPAEQDEWRAGRDFAAQRGLILDEASGLFASAQRDYNAGMLEQLLKLYDCEASTKRLTKNEGLVAVQNGYLSILGASTPPALAPYLRNPHWWGMGWWPRFAILTPEVARPEWRESADAVPEPTALIETLRHLYRRLPTPAYPEPPTAHYVTLHPGTERLWKQYAKAVRYDLLTPDLDERLYGSYGRLHVQALKVATLLAALDWPEARPAPRIDPGYMVRAIGIAEGWRESAHRALDATAQTAGNALRNHVLARVSQAGETGLSFRDLTRSMRHKDEAELQRELGNLEADGEVERVTAEPGPKGGRPSEKYRVRRP